jgi:hypothetical protein
MRIHVSYGPTRKKPKVGDRRTIRGIEHIRVFRRVHNMRGEPIGYDCTGGSQKYDWAPLTDAKKHGVEHHLTPAERLQYQDPADLKGRLHGKCNRSACTSTAGDVRWWNRPMHAYYCGACRIRINDSDAKLGTPDALFDPQPHGDDA